jgi:putative sigma-54 modulation protein
MKIQIQSLHFDASSSLTEFIQKKVAKLEKYSDDILEADVILKVVKPEISNNKDTSIKLKVKSGEFFANKIADTFEEAVDLSVEALEKQLVRFKEKTRIK